jgi:hypothetical protein
VNFKGWAGVRVTGGGENKKSLVADGSAPVDSAEALLADEMLDLGESGKGGESTRQSISEARRVDSSSDPGRDSNNNKPGIGKEGRTPGNKRITEDSPGIRERQDSMGKGTKEARNGRGPPRVPPIPGVERERVVPNSPPGPKGGMAPTQAVVKRRPSKSGPTSSSVKKSTSVNTVNPSSGRNLVEGSTGLPQG